MGPSGLSSTVEIGVDVMTTIAFQANAKRVDDEFLDIVNRAGSGQVLCKFSKW